MRNAARKWKAVCGNPLCKKTALILALFAALAVQAKDMRLFLLVGQSNMAGRGKGYQGDNAAHPNILKLDGNGDWVSGVEPVHFDKPRVAGAGLATSFARAYVEDNPGETVGLIPCAVGGTGIDRWVPGGDLFEKAVARVRATTRCRSAAVGGKVRFESLRLLSLRRI